MPGLDQEGLVDTRVVHVVGGRRGQTQENIQETQLLRQLWRGNKGKEGNEERWLKYLKYS